MMNDWAPTQVRIGATAWDLEFVDHIAGGGTAETAYWEGKIYIAEETPPGRWLPIVLHEILEVLNLQYGDALNLEHYQINVLAENLAQIIRDNIELILRLVRENGAKGKEEVRESPVDQGA